jgi:hypothetical protein
MFTVIATLAGQTGGECVKGDIGPKLARGEGAITEFPASAGQSYEEAFA